MPTRRTASLLLIAFAGLALVLAACTGAASPILDSVGNAIPQSAAGEATDVTAEDAARLGEITRDRSAIGSLVDDAKIVRTGTLELEVTGFAEALTKARTAITGLGGYISASEERHDDDRDFASVTYRIPVDRWDDATEALRGLATTVLAERTAAVEVTGQLVDLDARIANLRATEQALVAIMAKATKIPDILEVQGQLTTVRSEIEQLTAQREQLADQAAYGTLAVTWSTPAAPVVETRNAWDAAAEFERAVAALLSVGQVLTSAGIWLVIVGLPLLIVFAIPALIVWALARRLSRPHVTGSAGAASGS
jgi:hypothetical protein